MTQTKKAPEGAISEGVEGTVAKIVNYSDLCNFSLEIINRRFTLLCSPSITQTAMTPEATTFDQLFDRLSHPRTIPGLTRHDLNKMLARLDELKDDGDKSELDELKARINDLKSGPNYIAGFSKEQKRGDKTLQNREVAILEFDAMSEGECLDVAKHLPGVRAIEHDTFKSRAINPRKRLLVLLDRQVNQKEYGRLISWLASKFSAPMDDDCYTWSQAMYFPAIPFDGMDDYHCQLHEGGALIVDKVLQLAKQLPPRKRGQLTIAGRTLDEELHEAASKCQDPCQSTVSLVRWWCRAFSNADAIDIFLKDIFTPSCKGRYQHVNASSKDGGIIYREKGYTGDFFYCHHSNCDPYAGMLLNAFDNVRLHLYGHLDKDPDGTPYTQLPSFKKMEKLAETNKIAKKLIEVAEREDAKEVFQDAGEEWRQELTRDKRHNVVKRAANFQLIAENDPELQCIRYDVFHDKYVIEGGAILGRETPYLIDEVLADIAHHVDELYDIIGLSPNKVMQDIVTVISKSRRFHPVKEDIESVAWDGKPRVDTLLIRYLGAPDTPLTRAMTRKWMAAAVARIYEPGIKFDYILTLAGKEGTGKSTLLKVLGGDFYNDSFSFGRDPKEMGESVIGYWIIEAAELDGLNKSEIGAAKKFITSQSDNYREAYGRVVKEHPRQCVVAGTTNEECFLRTTTGARRWWIIDVEGAGDPAEWVPCLIAERGQIWAEAKVIYEEGEPLFLTASMEAEARELQRGHDRLHGDGIDAALAAWLDIRIPYNWHLKGFDERRNYYRWDVSQNDPVSYKYRQLVNARIVKAEHPEPSVQALSSQKINEIIASTGKWERIPSTVDFSKEYGSLYGQEHGWRRKPGTEPSIGDDDDDDL